MIAFRFSIENRERVLRGEDSLRPENLLQAGGRGVIDLLQAHLQKVRGERPQLADSFRGTISTALKGTAFVATIASAGIALRFFGGVEEAANDGAFTVLPKQEALGLRRAKNNNANATSTKTNSTVLFRLTKEKYYPPDPTLLPTDEQLSAAAMKPIENYLNNKNSNRGDA